MFVASFEIDIDQMMEGPYHPPFRIRGIGPFTNKQHGD